MGVFDGVKQQDINEVEFADLWLEHPDTTVLSASNFTHAHPCDIKWFPNQCAVRMSRASILAGIDFSDYPEPMCKGQRTFKRLSYATGAESLATYFIYKFGKKERKVFIINRNPTLGQAKKKELMNKKGIIFFRNIDGFRGGMGDHIDLWDGTQTTGGEYFDSVEEIWFWEIKK